MMVVMQNVRPYLGLLLSAIETPLRGLLISTAYPTLRSQETNESGRRETTNHTGLREESSSEMESDYVR